MLITPPPIDERQQFMIDQAKGFTKPRRSAENTKAYADAIREIASTLGIPVLDMWTRCMEFAGWKPGEPLCGDRNIPANERFLSLFVDGKWFFVKPLDMNIPQTPTPCIEGDFFVYWRLVLVHPSHCLFALKISLFSRD